MKLVSGDLIVIAEYITPDNVKLEQHTFVVLSTIKGTILSAEIDLNLELKFDLTAVVMSSIKNQAHKDSVKRHYPKSMIVEINDAQISNGNKKDGFIKADQLYYFKQKDITYKYIGRLENSTLKQLYKLLQINDDNGDLHPNYNNILEKQEVCE